MPHQEESQPGRKAGQPRSPSYTMSGDRLFEDVVTYSQLGEHRTATTGEQVTTDWIAEQLRAAGLEPSFQEFSLRQFLVWEATLCVGDTLVGCFPLWFPCGTGPRPVRGRLAAADDRDAPAAGNVALVRPPAGGSRAAAETEVRQAVLSVARDGALAAVLISRGPSGEPAAVNTPDTAQPWPIPVVLVGQKDAPALASAAAEGTAVSLLVDGCQEPQARARNVFGRYGSDQDVIVISTPKSGWFRCGGERGPGVALALAIARWVGQRCPKSSYWLDFNSGHELYNLGTRRFLEAVAPRPERVRCWLHLGANIATWRYEQHARGIRRYADPSKYRVVCSDPALLGLARRAFAGLPQTTPYMGEGIGELVPVFGSGYRGFGVYGGAYRYFHTPGDGPHGTAPELLEGVAAAVTAALEAVEAL